MLISMNDMLRIAQQEGFAVGAFNVSDNALLQCVVETAEECKSPAIIGVHPSELAYAKDDFFRCVTSRLAASDTPFVLHLDHGDNMQSVVRAIRCGFNSIMIDGSLLLFEENIILTKEVVSLCHMLNISVEGELGTIGSMSAGRHHGVEGIIYTNPDDAAVFVKETQVDTLAVAIGTAHGIYPEGFMPALKFDILHAITENIQIPLVLHGGSDNSDQEIRKAISMGISKINISSDYKRAIYKKLRAVLSQSDAWDPNTVFPPCIDEGKRVVKQKMELFDSAGKAGLYAAVGAWRQTFL